MTARGDSGKGAVRRRSVNVSLAAMQDPSWSETLAHRNAVDLSLGERLIESEIDDLTAYVRSL